MITLLNQYKKARRGLTAMLDDLGYTERDKVDRTIINSMINDTSYVIEWIEKGGNPDEMRGINVKSAYHLKYMSNMDILPDLTEELAKEREPLEMTDEQRKTILKLFDNLSDRERDCFLLHVAQNMSMQEVADELGISKWTVRTYIDRAKEKAKELVSHTCRT